MLNWICRRLELWTDRDTKGLLALDIAEFPSFSVPSASYHILWENDNRFINTANLFRVAQGKGSRDDESRVNVCFVKKDTKSSSNTSVLGILFLWNGHYPATVPDFPNPCWINFLFTNFSVFSLQWVFSAGSLSGWVLWFTWDSVCTGLENILYFLWKISMSKCY